MSDSPSTAIAEELAKQQEEISVAEFFEQNRQMLGFGSNARALVTAVKEAVDNSIDAAEEAGILPTVSVEIEKSDGYLELTIVDNGPGITKEQIPKIFGKLLYGSRFGKRSQTRGQQGIGISAAVLYSQLTTGKPTTITSKTEHGDVPYQYDIRIDTDTNEPIILHEEEATWENDSVSGTEISLAIEANFRARQSLHDYITYTAVVNPHVSLTLNEPDHVLEYPRTVNEVPDQPEEIRPHPHGIELGTLQSLVEVTDTTDVSSFLQSEFTRVGDTTATKIITLFRDHAYGREFKWNVPETTSSGEFTGLEFPRVDVSGDEVVNTPVDVVDALIDNSGNDSDNGDADAVEEDTESICTVLETPIAKTKAAINRKPDDVTNAVATQLWSEIEDCGPVTYSDIEKLVESVCDDVANEYNATLGDTVRDSIIDSTWEIICSASPHTLYPILSDVTSDKKTTLSIQVFAVTLAEKIYSSSAHGRYTYEDLESLVTTAAEKTTTETSVSFGETARSNITTTLWESMSARDDTLPTLSELESDRDLLEALHKGMADTKVMAPPSDCLSPIGEDKLIAGLEKVYDADFYTASQRDAGSHSGEPFVVEAGLAYGGDIDEDGSIDLLRFANRVPLVYQQGACCITNVATGIRWNNYKLSHKGSGLPQGPVSLVVHVGSTNVPFTSESKDAIANVDVIADEVERAIRDVALDMKKHIKKQATVRKRQEKQDKIVEILPEFSQKVASIIGEQPPDIKSSMARILNNICVTVTRNDEGTTIDVTNYTNNSVKTPRIELEVSGNGSALGDVEALSNVSVNESGDTVVWTPEVTDSVSISVPSSVKVTGVSVPTAEEENKATIIMN